MFNKCFLNGNLTKKPLISENGKYGLLTVAVQKNYKDKDGDYGTEFFSVMIAGEKLAEFYAAHFDKGDGVILECELSTRPNRFDSEGKAREIALVTRVFPSFATGKRSKLTKADASEKTSPNEEFEDLGGGDEDLPF